MSYSPESQKRYNQKMSTNMTIKMHNENDFDIIDYINRQIDQTGLSRQAVIKQIIRKQIELDSQK